MGAAIKQVPLPRSVAVGDFIRRQDGFRRGEVGRVQGVKQKWPAQPECRRLIVEWDGGGIGMVQPQKVHGTPARQDGYLLLGKERTTPTLVSAAGGKPR